MDIKDYLKYDQNTGNFHWLLAPSNSIRVGSVAGCRNEVGYDPVEAASAYQAFAKIHHGEFYRAC